MLLHIEKLCVRYGEAIAVAGINLRVQVESIVALLGANGAGKTTTLRAISGLIQPYKGKILFDGKLILGLKAYEIAKLGVTLCPEGRHVFPNLTVMENLLMGAYLRKDKCGIQDDIKWIFELFPILEKRANQMGITLSGGEQQMLVLGRAMMSRPKLLLLDEPSLGLSPLLVDIMTETIGSFNKKGTTILLVEQNINMALKLAKWCYLLETGNIIAEGKTEELFKDKSIEEVYLGKAKK